MDIFEYNDVCQPTRALQQEEEEQAVATAAQQLKPPQIQWVQAAGYHAKATLLVVALSPASSVLLETAAKQQGAQAVGHVVLPSDSSTAASSGKGDASVSAVLYAPAPGVLVCCCGATMPAERAGAWAKGVLQELAPSRLLLVGSMQVEQYRGDADASQELLAFVLQSDALRQRQQQQQQGLVAAYLPSGSIVSGLPAALLTKAELAGVPAELLVVVEQVPSLVPETLLQLARLVSQQHSLLRASSSSEQQQWAASLTQPQVIEAARLALQRSAYRPSSIYS